MKQNKQEILEFVRKLYKQNERIIDILLEVQRRYQLSAPELVRLLDKEMKAKLEQQEIKLRNVVKE